MISELQNKIQELENRIASIEQPTTTEEYGAVKLSDSAFVTEKVGLALPTTEKNPMIQGTLMNRILTLSETIDKYRLNYVSFLPRQYINEEKIGDVAKNNNVPEYNIYMFVHRNSGTSTIAHFDGEPCLIIGMEYMDHERGFQLGISKNKMRYRGLFNGIWKSWTTIAEQK